MSWGSNSTITSTTDSTSDNSGSLNGGYISIPQTDSSIEGHLDDLDQDPNNPIKTTTSQRIRQNYKGQLRIDINTYGRYITTHLLAARNIISRKTTLPDCFVEISYIPENRHHCKCISSLYRSSNRPVFDEKMSMELPVNYETKRVLISVWIYQGHKKNTEFLGCMSFGLHRADSRTQVASGWYYILTPDIGRKRHVKVIDDGASIKNYSDIMNISKIILCRNAQGGYGFSIYDSKPVRICRVDDHSSAQHHNLQKDDVILCIDGVDTSDMTSSQVALIIRNARVYLTMVLKRNPIYTADKSEDKIKNGIIARHLKTVFESRKNKNGEPRNFRSGVVIDYGWLGEEGDIKDSQPGSAAAGHASGAVSSETHTHHTSQQNPSTDAGSQVRGNNRADLHRDTVSRHRRTLSSNLAHRMQVEQPIKSQRSASLTRDRGNITSEMTAGRPGPRQCLKLPDYQTQILEGHDDRRIQSINIPIPSSTKSRDVVIEPPFARQRSRSYQVLEDVHGLSPVAEQDSRCLSDDDDDDDDDDQDYTGECDDNMVPSCSKNVRWRKDIHEEEDDDDDDDDGDDDSQYYHNNNLDSTENNYPSDIHDDFEEDSSVAYESERRLDHHKTNNDEDDDDDDDDNGPNLFESVHRHDDCENDDDDDDDDDSDEEDEYKENTSHHHHRYETNGDYNLSSSFKICSLRRKSSNPLSSQENLDPLAKGRYHSHHPRASSSHIETDYHYHASRVMPHESKQQGGRKGKAVLSKIKTVFKNRHAM